MTQYYAKIVRQKDKTFLVEFPGLPGCLSEGNSLEQAKREAKEALNGWLAARCDRNLNIPLSRAKKGKNLHAIDVEVQIEFAIELRRLRKKKGLSQKQVAHRLGVSQQAYAKLETPLKTNPSLVTIEKLSNALNVQIEIKFAA
jgi:predicted RNase H-like HicB family nuclease/DNA-binding Xre family transcriptional regulator